MDFHGVAGTHVLELRFFEIRGHPEVVQRHNSHQLLSRRNVLPGLCGSFRDQAIDGRDDARVTQVKLGLLHGSHGFLRGGRRSNRARPLDPNLLGTCLSRFDRSGSLCKPGLGLAYRVLRGPHIRRTSLYGGGRAVGGLDGLHIQLLRNFLFVNQLLVSLHIVLSLGAVRFGL